MFKAYKFRMYPTEEQKVLLEKHFGCARFIYNWGLDRKNAAYTTEKKKISTHQLMKDMVLLKKEEDFSWLKEVNSQSLQQSLWNLDDGFQRFFKKVSKFPTFKSKKRSKLSFNVPQFLTIDFKKSCINIPKFDVGIKVKIHRQVVGAIDSGTISKMSSGKYFISIVIDDGIEVEQKTDGNILGIDFGLKTFMTLSDGDKIERKDFLYEVEPSLKRFQRKFSKKVKGSKNREKVRNRISKIHEKIKNQRDDFLHKITAKIVDNQNYTFVGIEDLNIVGMMKNHSMSKRIGDLGWNKTTMMLNYKLKRVGKQLIKIGRFDPSSKLCSCCGKINQNLKLSDRTWKCSCGKVHDRDINAAINIKNFAEIILRDLGRESSDVKPPEKLSYNDLRKMIVKTTSVKEEKFNGVMKMTTLTPLGL